GDFLHSGEMRSARDEGGTVLIAAPVGKDAILAARVLEQAGVPARICASVAEAAREMSESTAGILLEEEALVASDLPVLLEALQKQPRWSDVPVVILTTSGGSERMSVRALDLFGPAGNVTLLERPLHTVTLVSAMKVALRARQRQYEVRELLEQREMVLSGISDAFSSLDREWRYVYVNDRVAELAGLPKEQMIGRNIWEIFPEAVGTEFYRLAHVAMEERRPVQGEFFHKPWGRWLDTRIYPTKGGIVIFRADITESKRHEEQLREREDLLRLATEAAGIGTFDYYPLTGELRFSARCKELFGLPPDAEVNYETYYNAVHPEDRHIVHETVREVLRPGRNRYAIEYRARGVQDGQERWLAEKGRAVVDDAGRATRFIGTIVDMTERKNAEIALQRAKQEAEEANRAKDQFLAMLSHELRTPLTPVLMTIASLRRQADLSDEVRQDLEVLQRNVELEALLIDDLLDLTRIKHGKLELHNDATDIHAALDYALNITASDLQEKKLRVTRRYDAREYHCWADGARLQQVFWNLVKNAVKFTPPGGRVDISTRNDPDHNIIVEVADTGIGIEADLLPRIFDAFEQGGRQVTSQFGGLGLGLAISKRVVDMHGGTITVSSAGVGQGATFTVTLKAMETSLLEGPVFLPADTRVAGTTAILLVEDHDDSARVLRRILEHAGYFVEHAASIARAKEVAGMRPFDLVISDLGLPDGNGLDLMRYLRATHGLTGVALSGFGSEEDRAASAAAGFTAHLTKPVDWPELRDAVQRLLAAPNRPALTLTN
ncbi:MAG TPA: ATP-binding protein, partial [Chthoniobacterales bacterium]|nr:ATP-binding protein [Chthoniobacterales bacterium]